MVFFFSISLNDFAPLIPIAFPVTHSSFPSFFLLFHYLSAQLRLSEVNVLFTFSISLNAFAPSSSILLSAVHSSFYSFLHVSFEIPLLSSINDVNVVFTSSISLNKLIPSFSISLPVNQSSLFPFVGLSFFFIIYNSDPVMTIWCSVGAFHSMLLFLRLSSHCLSIIHHFLHFLLFLSTVILLHC